MAPALDRMPVQHAQALARILYVTRAAWRLNDTAETGKSAHVRSETRRRRTAHLARLAARAFEAQVMALRCRQAFVG
ncbi:hypothetical protein EM868_14620 [Cupriavidus gilardii]|nr:hypothetical protein [Cupriavidus gilardii]